MPLNKEEEGDDDDDDDEESRAQAPSSWTINSAYGLR